ncbi:MAG: DUF1330 domain-containing protein [Bacteroidia bacterium]
MSESKAVLIINAIVNKDNASELQNYLGGVMKVFGANGGKPVGRFKTTDALTGENSPEMVAIIEFPNTSVIKEMVNGEAFGALGELRARVFTMLNMFIAESM